LHVGAPGPPGEISTTDCALALLVEPALRGEELGFRPCGREGDTVGKATGRKLERAARIVAGRLPEHKEHFHGAARCAEITDA
jgi:hypothetical protein